MRQKEFLPCDGKKCFFCVKGLTNGISHKRKATTVVVESKKKRRVIVGHIDFRVKLVSRREVCIAACAITIKRVQWVLMGRSSLQRRRKRNAIGLTWGAPSVVNKYVMCVGKRGTISTSHCDVPAVVMHKVYDVMS
jgi:hypothetical protein